MRSLPEVSSFCTHAITRLTALRQLLSSRTWYIYAHSVTMGLKKRCRVRQPSEGAIKSVKIPGLLRWWMVVTFLARAVPLTAKFSSGGLRLRALEKPGFSQTRFLEAEIPS